MKFFPLFDIAINNISNPFSDLTKQRTIMIFIISHTVFSSALFLSLNKKQFYTETQQLVHQDSDQSVICPDLLFNFLNIWLQEMVILLLLMEF